MSRSGSYVFVIFGGTGDLMSRKLLPALFYLAHNKLLPGKHAILAVARDRKLTEVQFRKWARKALAVAGLLAKQGSRNWCDACVHYQAVDETHAADYQALAARIADIERRRGMQGNRILYLALPPGAFAGTIEALAEAGRHRSKGWARPVIEKPVRDDPAAARRPHNPGAPQFAETQREHIDH